MSPKETICMQIVSLVDNLHVNVKPHLIEMLAAEVFLPSMQSIKQFNIGHQHRKANRMPYLDKKAKINLSIYSETCVSGHLY